jgi:carbon storage regulator
MLGSWQGGLCPHRESGYPERRIMLVLSRKKNESIVVDDAIVITVVEIRGDKVRLGIEAPREVPIHRSEVYAAIHHASEPGEQTHRESSADASHPAPDQPVLP